jgi:uncharacterized delta-60 repeat protein
MSTPLNPPSFLLRRSASGPLMSVLIPLLGLGWTVGCGDDSTDPGTSGGTSSGAKGGQGGSSGKGGSGANAGSGAGGSSTGGSGAKGGTTGAGGSGAQGGKGGKGGKGGTGGGETGGTGASGGTTGGSAGTAGEAGDSGSGGDAGNGSGGDAGAPTGSGGEGGNGPDAPVTIQKVFPLSATGPDRFFGVTYGADGSIFAVGQIAISNDSNADQALLLAKFTPEGNLDASFGAGGVVVRNVANGTNGEIYRGVVVQSTGKIVVAGNTEDSTSPTDARDRDIVVLRFNADGTKDTTWGTDGVFTLDLSPGVVSGSSFAADSAWGLERYSDDRLVVHGGQVRSGGTDTDFALVRLNADGTRDGTFGTNGVVNLDTQFSGSSDNASPRNVTILPGTDGVIGAGYRPLAGHDTAPVLWKVSDGGVVDTTFGVNGVFSEAVLAEQTESYQGVVQPKVGGGYNLVTTGYGKALAGETTDLVSLRVTSSGVLDTTYGTNGLVRVDIGGFGDNSRRLVVLPDRRIMLVGGGRLTSADVDGVVLLLTPDGQPDSTFEFNGWRRYDLGGPADFLWGVAISPDQKTAAIAGIKGVGNAPSPASANDDAALVLLPLP